MGHWKARPGKPGQHLGLPFDGMRALQELARWLAPQDIGSVRRHQLVGRIGLPALELFDMKRSGIAVDIRPHPEVERIDIETIALANGSRADIAILRDRHA